MFLKDFIFYPPEKVAWPLIRAKIFFKNVVWFIKKSVISKMCITLASKTSSNLFIEKLTFRNFNSFEENALIK